MDVHAGRLSNFSFSEHIEAGRLSYLDPRFNNPNWIRGDRVRGRFDLIKMGTTFEGARIEAEAAKVPGRRLATAYELVVFSWNGWNGTDMVVAFGSPYEERGCGLDFATISGLISGRNLYFTRAFCDTWYAYQFVLCIHEQLA